MHISPFWVFNCTFSTYDWIFLHYSPWSSLLEKMRAKWELCNSNICWMCSWIYMAYCALFDVLWLQVMFDESFSVQPRFKFLSRNLSWRGYQGMKMIKGQGGFRTRKWREIKLLIVEGHEEHWMRSFELKNEEKMLPARFDRMCVHIWHAHTFLVSVLANLEEFGRMYVHIWHTHV